MAESLGELIVSFSADLTKLDQGLKDADSKVAATADKIAATTQKVGLVLAATGAAITAAFSLMIKSAVDYGDELLVVSERTGVSVETLSRLKFVAEQTESSFEAIATGLKFLNKNTAEAERGNISLNIAFKELGVNLKDNNGHLKTADTLFLELADGFKKITSESEKTKLAIEIFGRSGTQLLPVLNLGSDGIKRLEETAKSLGLELSTSNAVAIDKFADQVKALHAGIGGLWMTISLQLLPKLTEIVTSFTQGIEETIKWANENKELVKQLSQTAIVIGLILTVSGALIPIIGRLVVLFVELSRVVVFLSAVRFAGLLTDIGLLIKNVGALYPAIVLVGTAFAAWEIGKFIGQLKQVQDIMTWIEAHATPGGIQRQKDQAALDETVKQTGATMQARGITPEMLNKQKEIGLEKQLQAAKDATAAKDKINAEQQRKALEVQADRVKSFANDVVALGTKIQGSFSTALSSLILHGENAKEIVKQLGASLVQSIVDFVAQQIIAQTIGVAIRALEVAAIGVFANAIGAEWVVPATLATIATFGGAAAQAPFQIGGALAGTRAIAMAGLAEGTDTVPTMLSPGEMVIPNKFSDAIRKGALSLGKTSESGDHYEINVKVDARVDNSIDIDKMSNLIGLRIEQKLRRIR